MIGLEPVHLLVGVVIAAFAAQHALDRSHPRRWLTTAFWGAYAVTFLAGSYLPDVVSGGLVLAMVIIAGAGGVRPAGVRTTSPSERRDRAARWGNRLFVPALTIPLVAVVGSLGLRHATVHGRPLVDPAQVTLVAMAGGTVVALVVAVVLLRPPPTAPLREGRRLLDGIGWAAVLPQLLAALGAVFTLAGVGRAVAGLVTAHLPADGRLIPVAAFTVGMAAFTVIMGNAFAAFPVMFAGVGLPVLIHRMHGDPVVIAAVGMLSGFCGTLMTPMAANFNIVPATLLELDDRHGVIRAQLPTGLLLLLVNTALIDRFGFRN
jgi:uncharacterized membrane protein